METDKECSTRIGKASSVFGQLTNIWRNKDVNPATKVITKVIAHFVNVIVQCRPVATVCHTDEETRGSTS